MRYAMVPFYYLGSCRQWGGLTFIKKGGGLTFFNLDINQNQLPLLGPSWLVN
jgi:hypothetical protein